MTPPPTTASGENLDHRTVEGFGDEWARFDQQGAPQDELDEVFAAYFQCFPWDALPPGATGFDAGCGSGRWAARVAPRIGHLHLVDASAVALEVARRNLGHLSNCTFHHASVDALPLPPGSMDFGYSLGVLHHVPDTQAGIAACVRALKPGAPLLLYLYYAFDNRPRWYRWVWRCSETVRRVVSRMPMGLRYAVSQIIAGSVYWPLARAAAAAGRLGLDARTWPLAFYADKSFYTMRTDALDRFGTRLEQRFDAVEIRRMMEAAGLEHIVFGDRAPFWCACGRRRRE